MRRGSTTRSGAIIGAWGGGNDSTAASARLQERGTRLASNQIQLSLLYPFALENGLELRLETKVVSITPPRVAPIPLA